MSQKVKTQRGAANPARGAYERSDMDGRVAGLTIVGLAGIVAIVGLCVAGLYLGLGTMRQPSAPTPRAAVPAPALQINERKDRLRIETRARGRLQGRDGGTPITDAMRQTAELGWDAPR